jgi:hypothetical protein
LNWLNSRHQKIQFTTEEVQSGQLPFLEVMVKRQDNKLIFDVYRKPTSTKRYITADSFHPQFQKNAAFHSMAHRLCNFNLSEEKYLKEKDTKDKKRNEFEHTFCAVGLPKVVVYILVSRGFGKKNRLGPACEPQLTSCHYDFFG